MFLEYFEENYQKKLSEGSKREIYEALHAFVGEKLEDRGFYRAKKKLYYLSAEFLIGKLLSNHLINLGVYDEVREELSEAGFSLADLEEEETEPSLGNGGLGRLAACFLDSAATLGLCADGVGLCYHFGLFRQVFHQEMQREEPNPWMEKPSWLKETGYSFRVPFGGFSLDSVLYEMEVSGYGGRCNRLCLFDVKTVEESVVGEGISFDPRAIPKNLTLFLYPDDSTEDGRLLRIYQQYFLVCNAAQLILAEAVEKGSNLHDLADYAAVQINDTHPTLIIPELIYRLEQHGIEFFEAAKIVRDICAYTNHTILAEALETWPVYCLERVVPHLMTVIRKLSEEVEKRYPAAEVQIIDRDSRVHMARLDIHCGSHINGVAALHTEILKSSELAPFYRIYPEKFSNKTNGITFRRWLLHANPSLTALLDEAIGGDYHKDAKKLEKLLEYVGDGAFYEKLLAVKRENKKRLAEHLLKKQGIRVDCDAVFDVQIKRLHEYKRQQMHLLALIDRMLEIREGRLPKRPIISIFGAKAAPAYLLAKDIIHAILCLQRVIEQDENVRRHLRVFMVENYNVTEAEFLIPAAELSEQISLASKEASGTGNMKMMLNGALTLGTLDGANAEIAELVGEENIYLFGKRSEEVLKIYREGAYSPGKIYAEREKIRRAVDFLTGEEMLRIGQRNCLERLKQELCRKDWFMSLLDLEEYIRTKECALSDYEDRTAWAGKMLVNIAKAGYFSSDRTVEEYNRDIWHLEKQEGTK